MISLVKNIVKKWNIITDLAQADFRKRFAGSYFGVAWMFIQPIVTVFIYFCIFQLGFKSVPPIPNTPYVLWLVPGIVPWFYFMESLSAGTNVLQEYHYLVKKVVFDVELLPVIKLISCMFVHFIFILIMLVMFLCYGRLPMLTWIQIVYYSFALSVLELAIIYITSAVNVFFRDMAQIVAIILQFGMWATPIMWDPGMFANIPNWVVTVLKINPVYYIVTGCREAMLAGTWFWERPGLTAYFWIFTLVLLTVGLRLFRKMRPHFSDVL